MAASPFRHAAADAPHVTGHARQATSFVAWELTSRPRCVAMRAALTGRVETMAKQLEGKVAAVTGAASGIGLASSEAMLARARAW